MKLKPLAGYVLIEPLDEDEVTASGLALPEKAKEKPAKGKVLEVGAPKPRYEAGFATIPGKMTGKYKDLEERVRLANEDPQVKKGDKVVFHRWSGQDVKEGQKELKLVKFEDLMGVYE